MDQPGKRDVASFNRMFQYFDIPRVSRSYLIANTVLYDSM